MRNLTDNFAAAAFRQPFFNEPAVGDGLHEKKLTGNIGSTGVKLLYEFVQYLGGGIPLSHRKPEMISSNHLPVPHKEDLHHGVTAFGGNGNDIPVFMLVAGSDLLLFPDLLHTKHQVTYLSGLFEIHIFRSCLHPFCQNLLHLSVIASLQKIQRLIDLLPVFFPGKSSLTGGTALS